LEGKEGLKTLNLNELKNINGGDVWKDLGKATHEVLPYNKIKTTRMNGWFVLRL